MLQNRLLSSVLPSVRTSSTFGLTALARTPKSSRMASTTPSSRPSRLFDKQPAFIYGTAWKKDQTKRLVKEALVQGFRRVDTAAQPRHYQEALVGEALREAYTQSLVTREGLYVQTKYTTPAGQDLNNIPYDPEASLDEQISTSISSSLKNLRHDSQSDEGSYIDCLLLHSPLPTVEQTLQAWKIVESFVPDHVRSLGISNVTLPVLKAVYEHAKIKPSIVQNRFYHKTSFDIALRAFCTEHGITYQSFWTLTGNPVLLKSPPVISLAEAAGINPQIALYSLVIGLDIEVLNGTSSVEHMREDFEGIQKVREWASADIQQWDTCSNAFKGLIDSFSI